ncbi:resolvase [Parasedimentitalea denitrificans]|uniref:resolvase n=1 Tax=Parasedimentitalea denitrificans TaxID=2211118 RepID=UPI00142FF0B2|nr:resolvase [Sedimentitalea sp. CY04]
MAEQDFDLFGDPVRLPNGKRGRPAHVPSQKNRNKIIVLLALGWGNERIAGAMHISQPTLRRYYFSELKRRDIQRDRLDAWRFEKIVDQVESGNVGAMRLLDQMIAKNDQVLTDAKIRAAQNGEKKTEYIGKKEVDRQAADSAVKGNSPGWEDDLTPGKYN